VFIAFLRLGLTAFGGPAMVAYIRELAVTKRGWLGEESFQDGVALCQSIPGATAMQTAAYVGLRVRGPLGALASFVGFGLPAFVLMVILSAVYQASRDVQPVLSAFRCLNVIVVALVANAVLNFGRSSIKNWRDLLLAAGAAGFLILHGSPIIAIAASAALSLLLYHGVNLPVATTHAHGPESKRRTLMAALVIAMIAVAGLGALFFLNPQLFNLGALMMKVDVFAFGGGYASVPIMLHEVVDVRHWMDSRTFMDGIALGQVTPGPIVITATFVGLQIAGLAGAVVGTLGVFTPSFLMVLITVPYFDRLSRWVVFRRALRGVLASFVGLLLAVAVSFGIAIAWNIPAVILAVAAFAALRFKVDILWVVLVGAGLSVFIL
jgi:chromate transporter